MRLHKYILSILLLLPLLASAQQEIPRFGYISYSSVIAKMPEYARAQQQFAELKGKYEAEATRSEEEFQRKFAEFMQGQRDFPPTIMQKRQAELQELMEKSISFRRESQQLLVEAEQALKQPAIDRLNEAIRAIGSTEGLMFILNTDGNAVPFMHPDAGIDITAAVLQKLGLAVEESSDAPAPTDQ